MALVIVICILVFIALAILLWACIEPSMLKVTNTVINSNSKCNLRILYFSDLHAEYCYIPVETVIQAIEDNVPDIVIFGGDICNKPAKCSKGVAYLKAIADYCKSSGIPFIGTTGNHDVEINSSSIAECGFNNINSGMYLLTDKNSRQILFTGLYDSGRNNRVWQTIPENIPSEFDYHICLSHNPDQIKHLGDIKPNLMISGHIHGGQIRTPIKLEFIIRKDDLPRKGIISGLHHVDGVDLFISKGIGCVGLPFRLGVKPEINIIDIK